MNPFQTAAAVVLLASASSIPSLAVADCLTSDAGARCVRVEPQSRPLEPSTLSSASAATPLVGVGDVLPRGEYSVILNSDYYGLPPASDGWVYMRVGSDAYRVDWQSHEVIERVTDRVAANF